MLIRKILYFLLFVSVIGFLVSMESNAETMFWFSDIDKAIAVDNKKNKLIQLNFKGQALLITKNSNNGDIWTIEKEHDEKNYTHTTYYLHQYDAKGKHKKRTELANLKRYSNQKPTLLAHDPDNELIYLSIGNDVLRYYDTGEYVTTYTFAHKPLFLDFDNTSNNESRQTDQLLRISGTIVVPVITALLVMFSTVYVPRQTHKLLTKKDDLTYQRSINERNNEQIDSIFRDWMSLVELIEYPNSDEDRKRLKNDISIKAHDLVAKIEDADASCQAKKYFGEIDKLLSNRNIRDDVSNMDMLRRNLHKVKKLCYVKL